MSIQEEPRFIIKGDWRPVCDALDAAFAILGRPQQSSYSTSTWNLAAVIFELAQKQISEVKCAHCGKKIHHLSAFRCFDCKATLCEYCAPSHFGPQHQQRAALAHPSDVLHPMTHAQCLELCEKLYPDEGVKLLHAFVQGIREAEKFHTLESDHA